MTCKEVRESLGAYVLGTLDDDEAALVRAHAETCEECRQELDALSVLPAYLALVPVELAVEGPPEPGPSDLMLRRLLGAVASERTHRRRTQWLSAAAVLVLVAGSVLVAVLIAGWGGAKSAPSASGGRVVAVSPTVDPATNVRADLTLRGVAWGSKLTMHLSGVPSGLTCSLVAYGPDGERQVAATYKVPDADYQATKTFTVDGALALTPADVRRVDVVSNGTTLVTVRP